MIIYHTSVWLPESIPISLHFWFLWTLWASSLSLSSMFTEHLAHGRHSKKKKNCIWMSLCYSKTTSMSLLWELVGNADSLWLGPSDSESAFYSEWFRCTLPSEKQIGGSLLGARLSEEIMKTWNGSLQPRQWKTVKRSAVICRSFGNPCPQTPHLISRIAAKHLSPPSRKNGVKGKKKKERTTWDWTQRSLECRAFCWELCPGLLVTWLPGGVNLQLSLTRLFYSIVATEH